MKIAHPAFKFQREKMRSHEPGELSGTLDWLASIAQKYFNADFCVFFPMNPVTRLFFRDDPIVAGSLEVSKIIDFNKPREDGLARLVLSKKILFIDSTEIESYHSPITKAEKIKAFTGFGLFTSRLKTPLAVVYLDYKKNKKFGKKFQAEIAAFIKFASVELQSAWFIRRYREITRVGQDINESFENIDDMFDRVYKHLRGILDVNYSFSLLNYDSQAKKADLYLIEEGNKQVKKNYRLVKKSASDWVIKNLRTIAFNDFYREKMPEDLQPTHIPGTAAKERSAIFVPIKINDEPFGVLSIQHPKRGYYDKEDIQILELLANHIALALNNNRLMEDLKSRRLKELKGLRQIDKEISRTLDLDVILNIILKLTSKHIKMDNGVILLYNRKFNAIEVKAYRGLTSRPENQRLDQYKGIIKSAFEMRKTIRINDVQNDLEWKDKYIEFSKETHSELAVPLLLGKEAIGVMNFESNEKNAYSEDSQWFIETLAGQAVIAIKNANEYEKAQRIASEREALIEIVNKLIIETDIKAIFKIILNKALEITKTKTGSIAACDEESKEIINIVAEGVSSEWFNKKHSFEEGYRGLSIQKREDLIIPVISKDANRDRYIKSFEADMESELVVLIYQENERIVGVINLENESPSYFDNDDLELIKSLASLCAVGIKNAQDINQKRLALIGFTTLDLTHKMEAPLTQIEHSIIFIKEHPDWITYQNTYFAEMLDQIDLIASNTKAMIREVLEDTKRKFVSPEKTSLQFIISKTLANIEMPKNKDITLIDSISDNSGTLNVFATPALANALQNLIRNSIRAIPSEGGVIYISLESMDKNWVVISVEDTGKGILEEEVRFIFEPLSGKERDPLSHRLGLFITKNYINTIGGKIDYPVKGRDGVGTKFLIHLKRA